MCIRQIIRQVLRRQPKQCWAYICHDRDNNSAKIKNNNNKFKCISLGKITNNSCSRKTQKYNINTNYNLVKLGDNHLKKNKNIILINNVDKKISTRNQSNHIRNINSLTLSKSREDFNKNNK